MCPSERGRFRMSLRTRTRAFIFQLLRLQEIFDQGIFEGKPLAPGFAAPEPEGMDHHLYSVHIKNSLPEETPGMFGMPANAETGYLTNAADEIFAAFLRWVGVIVSESHVPSTSFAILSRIGSPAFADESFCRCSPKQGWRRWVPVALQADCTRKMIQA